MDMKPSPLYARRYRANQIGVALSMSAMVLGLVALLWILVVLFSNGFAALDFSIFTNDTPAPGSEGGGLRNAIVGSLLIVGLTVVVSTPVGILAGVYLTEYGDTSKTAEFTRFITDIMLSAPSIVLGLCMGSGAVISMQYGGGEEARMRQSVFQSFALIAGISLAVNLLVYLGLNGILWVLRVPVEIRPLMKQFFWAFVVVCVVLGYCGHQAVDAEVAVAAVEVYRVGGSTGCERGCRRAFGGEPWQGEQDADDDHGNQCDPERCACHRPSVNHGSTSISHLGHAARRPAGSVTCAANLPEVM